jgi:hypothetical protein
VEERARSGEHSIAHTDAPLLRFLTANSYSSHSSLLITHFILSLASHTTQDSPHKMGLRTMLVQIRIDLHVCYPVATFVVTISWVQNV